MKHLIEIDVFDAGLNTKAAPLNLLPGQSADLNHVLFNDYGSVINRSGIATYNSTPFGSASLGVNGLHSFRPSTMSALLFSIWGGKAYVMTGAATTPVTVPSSEISAGAGVFGIIAMHDTVQMNEVLFISQAFMDYPYKFNGQELTKAGISSPSQVLTAVCDAASGNLNGTYQYVFWGVNSYAAEGDYGSASTAVAVTSAKVRVNNIPTAPVSHGITTWKVGRNTAGAQGIFWYLTDIANGTTSFTDNVADASLVTEAPIDQGYVRSFQCMCVYASRLWGADGDLLWYSNVNQPEEFPSTNFIRVGRGDGLNISAITPYMGMIMVSKSSYIPDSSSSGDYDRRTALYALIIGDSVGFSDPENWYLRLVAEDVGSESNLASLAVAGYLWLTSRKGVQLFNGQSVTKSVEDAASGSVVSDKVSSPVESLFELDLPSRMRQASAIVWKDRVYLSYERVDGGKQVWDMSANNETLVYDYNRVGKGDPRKGGWTRFSGFGAHKWVVHEDKLIGGNPAGLGLDTLFQSAGPYLFHWDTGNDYDRNGSPVLNIIAAYQFAPIRGKKEHVYHDKDFRQVNLWVTGTGTYTFTFKVNGLTYGGATTIKTQDVDLTTAGGRIRFDLPGGFSAKHLWMKFSFAETGEAGINVTRLQVYYNLRGLRNA